MSRLILLFTIATLILQAKHISFDQVHNMPKSISKDYYIWRFLKEHGTTKKDARRIIKEIKRANPKIRKAYRKKTGQLLPVAHKSHKDTRPSAEAVAAYKKRVRILKNTFDSADPFKSWLALPNKDKIFVFNHASHKQRKLLDHKISSSLFGDLTTHIGFNRSIDILRKSNLPHIKTALLDPPASKNALNYRSLNYLAFHALYAGKNNIATKYFLLSSKKAKEREGLDRALFWAYMASKDKKYLQMITKSYDINMYILLARDMLGLKYHKPISPKLSKSKLLNSSIITDPIYWERLKKKIFDKTHNLNKLADQYKFAQTVGYYTYIKAKASRDKEQYFPMPYRDMLSKLPITRQAMMYAVIRQESRFVPASISSSFALGMMQIMPFLVDHLAKQRHEKIDYDDMFDPKTALIYGNEHMNYLTKWLKHPLYIAYAYNAGIGFTRRMLKSKRYFTNYKGYEPYLSIERLPNAQARRYGKHVMTNYVIYMNLLGVPLRMIDLIKTLHIPSKTDKFRK